MLRYCFVYSYSWCVMCTPALCIRYIVWLNTKLAMCITSFLRIALAAGPSQSHVDSNSNFTASTFCPWHSSSHNNFREQEQMLLQAAVPSCSGCGKIVTDETQALQCDKCMSNDSWKCAECLNLTADLYDCLVSGTVVSIRWFCDNCDKKVMDNNQMSQCQS